MGKRFIFYDEKDKILGNFIFGYEGLDYQHNYIRELEEDGVYRTNNNIFYLLNTSVTYWGKNPPKPEIEIDTTKTS